MQWYFVSPLDVLLFRESKPFSPNDGSWAKGLFPPMPITVFQALRSLLPERTQRQDKQRDLEFMGVFLVDPLNQVWLPTPKDLIVYPEQTNLDRKKGVNHWRKIDRLQPLNPTAPEWEDIVSSQTVGQMVVRPDAFPIAPVAPPLPWMKATAVIDYLQGQLPSPTGDVPTGSALQSSVFHGNPWDVQILPHIHMQSGTKQVRDAAGYFTEVAIRLASGWRLLVGMKSPALPVPGVIRLGGEGHRAIVEMASSEVQQTMTNLLNYQNPRESSRIAYLLTPGLAEIESDSPTQRYGTVPSDWSDVEGCISGRAILWGGISKLERRKLGEMTPPTQEFALLPQRAFVPPGSVYWLKQTDRPRRLLPVDREGPKEHQRSRSALRTFETLNYGLLLWGNV